MSNPAPPPKKKKPVRMKLNFVQNQLFPTLNHIVHGEVQSKGVFFGSLVEEQTFYV